jgi:hypothetical protein
MSLLINEVHPNQTSGSEWIEFLCEGELTDELSAHSVYDDVRKIYQFSNEACSDGLIVIEVSGLNNDKDSVTIKHSNGEIIDSFTYQSTEKGLSWSKQSDGSFLLSSPSRGASNPIISNAEPSVEPTPTTSSSPTIKPTSTDDPSSDPISIGNSEANASPIATKANFQLPYAVTTINLQATAATTTSRDSRLVILGQPPVERQQILSVIMASCLMLFSAMYLLYVKKKSSCH